MIALDASTVLQSFREGAYDIKELGEKLQALVSESGTVVFKYADGSALMFPSASLITHLTPYFASLSLTGGVKVVPHNGALAIYGSGRPGTLSALLHTLVADTRGTLLAVKSHIVTLTVSKDCSISDLSAWAQANNLRYKTVSANNAKIDTVTATGVSNPAGKLHVSVPAPSDDSVAASASIAQVRSEVAVKPDYQAGGLSEPNTIGFYGSSDYLVEHIVLTSQSMSLQLPRREASNVTTTVTCQVPYHTSAGWESLPVDSYEVYREDVSQVVPAQGAMRDFLLWPRWAMQGSSVTARTFAILPGAYGMSGPAPVIRVENVSSGTLELPHVWAFSKGSDGKGKVSVLHKVEIGPYSCKEFEFRHNASANCGYMYPLSAWY